MSLILTLRRLLSPRLRREMAHVKTLAPAWHRMGLDPEITQAYLDGRISSAEWGAEANRVSKQTEEWTKLAMVQGVPAEAFQAYFVDRTISYDELEVIINAALGKRLLEIADACEVEGRQECAKWIRRVASGREQ
jgi:hypothetical protein